MDIAEVRKRKRPATRGVRVCVEPDLLAELDSLRVRADREEIVDARENRVPVGPQLRREIEQLEDRILEATVEFKFKALPRPDWLALIEEHPPRPADVEDGLDFNLDSIAAPLLAASCADPEMTISDAEAICSEWSEAEFVRLMIAATKVQREVRDIPFTRRDSEPADRSIATRSSTPPAEE